MTLNTKNKMKLFQQYDIFILTKDLNAQITKGIQGVILEILGKNDFLIEFVQEHGTNHDFNGDFIFTVDKSFLGKIT